VKDLEGIEPTQELHDRGRPTYGRGLLHRPPGLLGERRA